MPRPVVEHEYAEAVGGYDDDELLWPFDVAAIEFFYEFPNSCGPLVWRRSSSFSTPCSPSSLSSCWWVRLGHSWLRWQWSLWSTTSWDYSFTSSRSGNGLPWRLVENLVYCDPFFDDELLWPFDVAAIEFFYEGIGVAVAGGRRLSDLPMRCDQALGRCRSTTSRSSRSIWVQLVMRLTKPSEDAVASGTSL